MLAPTRRAYHEIINLVESHQVTLSVEEQYKLVAELVEVLTEKRDALQTDPEPRAS